MFVRIPTQEMAHHGCTVWWFFCSLEAFSASLNITPMILILTAKAPNKKRNLSRRVCNVVLRNDVRFLLLFSAAVLT